MRQREGATEGTREGKGNRRRRKEKDDKSKERERGGLVGRESTEEEER